MLMLALSAGLGLLGAKFAGLEVTCPHAYEVVMHGLLVFIAGWLLIVFGALRMTLLSLAVLGALPYAMYQGESWYVRILRPTNQFVQIHTDVPVTLRTRMVGRDLEGEITYTGRDWLYQAEVNCNWVYANGNRSDKTLVYNVGPGTGWLRSGESFSQPLVKGDGIGTPPGVDVSRTECRVVGADVYRDPKVKPQFTVQRDPRSRTRYTFTVHNDQARSLRAVKFSCWVSFSGRRVKTDYAPRPLYQDDENYIVKPGEDVVLYIYESFTLGRDLEECAIKDVNWL